MKIFMQILAVVSVGMLGASIYFLIKRIRLKRTTRHMKGTNLTLNKFIKQSKMDLEDQKIEEQNSLFEENNNYKILHKKLKLQFWICFGITIGLWIILLAVGFGTGFYKDFGNFESIEKATKVLTSYAFQI
ncbi:hypothetical protein [Williamsoniiplasma lucivorax]|uniref:Uncharacterized protein n=1 Tax=Williamsoniiplasma lucivorax TaxID=209274 RepID=A0A2S5R958_9MOLU|nr:hypothetical protein [Williamsoniiplasma lucivorax]PPE03823.1 hypothetical protein ELUCI_v1c09680 [Williamsoniiplasma lucivorax]